MNNNGDDGESNDRSEAEETATKKKVKQETPSEDGIPLDAPSRLLQEPNRSLEVQEEATNLPRPSVPIPNYPVQPHLPYNPLATGPFLSPPHPFPFVPPPAAHYHQPYPPNLPTFYPPPSQPHYPSPNVSIQYYEARMRDHAAAYASAAAGAAWAAAQMAAAAADFAAGAQGPMTMPPYPPFHPPTQYNPMPPFLPSDHHYHHNYPHGYDDPQLHHESSDTNPPHRKKRRPRLEDVPNRIRAKQHRGRRRGGEDSSSNSSCSTATFVRKSERRKKDRSDESLLGKTAVAALYEWCSRRNHLPSFVLQQMSPNLFDCVVTLEDDVEWGHGQGGNKGAAKKEAAKQALQSLCPTVVFDETSGFVTALRNAVEDLAPHLAKQLAIDAVDDNISSTTEFSEDDNDFFKSAQGATVLSNLLFTTIQIDPRIKEAVPVFTYQVVPVVQHHPLKRKTTTSDASRGRFTCIAELKMSSDDGNDKDTVIQAKGVGTSKRDARHMACAHLLVKLFPECDGDFAKVKEAAEAARSRYKVIRMNARSPPFHETIVSSFQRILDHDALPTVSSMRLASRRKQLDSRVEKALHHYHEEGKVASTGEADVGRTVLRRAEPQDLTLVKNFLWSNKDVPVSFISGLWSSSCIVLLLCRDPSYQDLPLGCVVCSLGFQFPDGQLLRVKHLSAKSHLPRERFMDCLKDFAKCMDCVLVEDVGDCNPALSVKCEDAQVFVQNQLRLRLKTPPSLSQTLQSVQEEDEGSEDSEKRPVSKVVVPIATNPSKRSRVV